MKYLVDVKILCEPTKSAPNQGVLQWLESHKEESVIDAVVLGEIWDGIVSLTDGKKKYALQSWFQRLRRAVHCLAWTDETAIEWGELQQVVRKSGFTVGVKDTMIADTARQRGLIVVTRNEDDFTRCGVQVVNPFNG